MKLDLLNPTYSSRMEAVSKKRSWIPRRSTSTRRYHRLQDTANGSGSVRTARLGGGADDGGGRRGRRFMVKIKRALKLRFPKKMAYLSSRPAALLWTKLKDGYMNMMLSLAGNVGQLNGNSAFGNKRIPKARKVRERIAQDEFEDRLVFEIYKALMASRELEAAAASAAASADQRQHPTKTTTATIVADQI